ncbi:MAG: CobQ/CobB/MinD/ParA nucleotide binding domain protein [Firmicutes bacterium ADurb.Bin419]|nr:MAG: CobQ/CobB/MinD/ParA nucleotide binding domain protein [Firmicutes bacterium ADurb.Bin419]
MGEQQQERVDVKEILEKLSPRDKIYSEIETNKIIDNVIVFWPSGDSTDTSILVANLAASIAKKGWNVCIIDFKVFYPNIYKLLDCEALPKGRGLIKLLRSDKVDHREEITDTKYKNLYLLSPSPMDLIEEYFDFQFEDIDRLIDEVKEMFDLVLIDVPNIPPLEFCVGAIKQCNVGFCVWSERIDCPQNAQRFLSYIGSLGISSAKIANVILNNVQGFEYDKQIITEMGMKYIGEFPLIPAVINYSLEGRVYSVDSLVIDRRYQRSMERLVELLAK